MKARKGGSQRKVLFLLSPANSQTQLNFGVVKVKTPSKASVPLLRACVRACVSACVSACVRTKQPGLGLGLGLGLGWGLLDRPHIRERSRRFRPRASRGRRRRGLSLPRAGEEISS